MSVYKNTIRFCLTCFRRSGILFIIATIIIALFLALSPVIELYVIKRLGDFLNTSQHNNTQDHLYIIVVEISLLYILLKFSHYYLKVWRIQICNKLINNIADVFSITKIPGWSRVIIMEITLQFISFIQIMAILAYSLYINIILSIFIIIASIINFLILFFVFKIETNKQLNLLKNSKENHNIISGTKILSRVKSTEISVLATGILTLLLIISLIFFRAYMDIVSGIVFIFLIRIFGSTFNTISGSLMRLARAYVYSVGTLSTVLR